MTMMIFQDSSRQSGKTPTVRSVPRTKSRVGSVYGVGIFKRDAITPVELAILKNRREEALLSALLSFLRNVLLSTPRYIRPF